MENENQLPDEHEMEDVIILTDDDGNEYPLYVLSSKTHNENMYLLTAVTGDDDDNDEMVEVILFRCIMDESEDEEMSLETIDDDHEDFELVIELFKDEYEEFGIIVDEGDSPLGI